MENNQVLTNEQLEKQLSSNNCCDKKMLLVETHQEKGNRVCYKYICSQCNSSIFAYGEKSKKSITLTAAEYENLLSNIRNIHQRLYENRSNVRKKVNH